MSKPTFILSPCGTSLLTNGISQELRSIVNKYSNVRSEDEVQAASPEQHRLIREHLAAVATKLAAADPDSARKFSAELNGILSICGGTADGRRGDFHQLLCTDTWLGEEAAQLVKQWLSDRGPTAELRRQKDLRTVELASFQAALSDLVQWCDNEIESFRKKGYRVIFNLTGGFKSIQGFLQTLAQFYADETVYIFETGNELLRLPRLPIRMAADDVVRQHLSVFRRLDLGLQVPDEDLAGIPETLLMTMCGQTCLSPWGDLVWKQSKKGMYCEEVHPLPVGQTVACFGKDFMKSVEGCEGSRKAMINDRLDALIRYLEEKRSGKPSPHNPPSLDFKGLTGNPCPPSTHECDAWADQDAKRLFGHFDSYGSFILDRLGKALH